MKKVCQYCYGELIMEIEVLDHLGKPLPRKWFCKRCGRYAR